MNPNKEGFTSSMIWGLDAHVIERFGRARVSRKNISITRDKCHFISPGKSPADFIELFRRFYGPTTNGFEAAEQTGKFEDLYCQPVDLAKKQNKSANGGASIPPKLLRVTFYL